MNIKLNNLFVFAAGLAIGAGVTYKVITDRYERMFDELYANEDEDEEVEEEPASHGIEEMRKVYADIARDAKYIKKEDEDVREPYIISNEEFDTNTDYNKDSLTYYMDGVVTDMDDDVINFVEDLIGDINPEEHFGEYEADTVYVRNERTKTDYEILRDLRTYYHEEE